MGTRDKAIEPPQILSGWKNIARHLGMGVRTVQRYERMLGLPVRRPAGRPRAAVVATKSELDAWVAASPIREAFQLTKQSPKSQGLNEAQLKLRIKEMHALGGQMLGLRSDLENSLRLMTNSIENLRADLRSGRWETPALSILEDNPQTRRLREWLSMDSKGRKAI